MLPRSDNSSDSVFSLYLLSLKDLTTYGYRSYYGQDDVSYYPEVK